jgi:glucose uptake protein GlcU
VVSNDSKFIINLEWGTIGTIIVGIIVLIVIITIVFFDRTTCANDNRTYNFGNNSWGRIMDDYGYMEN